jgi:hypothetical protein
MTFADRKDDFVYTMRLSRVNLTPLRGSLPLRRRAASIHRAAEKVDSRKLVGLSSYSVGATSLQSSFKAMLSKKAVASTTRPSRNLMNHA